MRAPEQSVAYGGPGGALSVLNGSVSAVGVTCDSETVHVLHVCIEPAPETLSRRLGRCL